MLPAGAFQSVSIRASRYGFVFLTHRFIKTGKWNELRACARTRDRRKRVVGMAISTTTRGGASTASVIVRELFRGVIDPDTNLGTHPAINLPDSLDTTVRFQILIPPDFNELVLAQIIVAQTATGGSPNMQWSTATNFGQICADQDYDTHTDAETDQTTGITQNDLECIDVSDSLDGIVAGDIVGFEFIRRATQAGDTINAAAYFLGFRFQYV